MDKTLCKYNQCKLSETCVRFNTTQTDSNQWYFSKDPSEKDGSCAFYINLITKENKQ